MNSNTRVNTPYENTFYQTRAEILSLCNLSEIPLDAAYCDNLIWHYGNDFLPQRRAPGFADQFAVFEDLVREIGAPRLGCATLAPQALSIPETLLLWAWCENYFAFTALDGDFAGLDESDAIEAGEFSAMIAQQAIEHAKLLMAISGRYAP